MDKLISGQAAIDAIDVLKRNYPPSCFEELCKAVDIAIAALSAQLEQRWIPCSERLPDNDESVLISNRNGVTKAWWNGRFWESIAVKKYKTVTAWMPLPEPYKEGNNEWPDKQTE